MCFVGQYVFGFTDVPVGTGQRNDPSHELLLLPQ